MAPMDKDLARALEGAPKLIVATVILMERMVTVLTQEVDIVLKRKIAEHPPVLREKQKLAMEYRNNMKAIDANPSLVKGLKEEARAALKAMTEKLARAVDDNAKTLQAAICATQNLVQNMISSLRSRTVATHAYKNPNKARNHTDGYRNFCDPVAVNKSV